jgi:hypothetical protein
LGSGKSGVWRESGNELEKKEINRFYGHENVNKILKTHDA